MKDHEVSQGIVLLNVVAHYLVIGSPAGVPGGWHQFGHQVSARFTDDERETIVLERAKQVISRLRDCSPSAVQVKSLVIRTALQQ